MRKIKVNTCGHNFSNCMKKFITLKEGQRILRHCLRVSPSISRNSVRAHRDMQRRLRNGTATIVRRHGKVRDKFACQTPGVHSISRKSFHSHVSVIITISPNFRREIEKNNQKTIGENNFNRGKLTYRAFY